MTFKPPIKSKDLLEGIPFDQADDTEPAAKKRFDDFDKTGTKDPNKCKALLQFPNGAVFWSSKMAVDADGPAAAAVSRRKRFPISPFRMLQETVRSRFIPILQLAT